MKVALCVVAILFGCVAFAARRNAKADNYSIGPGGSGSPVPIGGDCGICCWKGRACVDPTPHGITGSDPRPPRSGVK